MTARLDDSLRLPCGAVLPNRLCKAAMTEGLANPELQATPRHERLYRLWSEGGAGLLISGNVIVDRHCLERPGNVAIAGNGGLPALRAWARAGTAGGNHLWMQLSHAGRQSPRYVTSRPVAPSAVRLPVLGNYATPRALEQSEILDIVQRFAHAARTAREAGFTGVQLHAAHGYLLSSFLSPVANRRDDAWGGSVENRARILVETVRATRRAVGADFPVSVKLNSDDFRKGGFSNEDCLRVVEQLNGEGIDLLEISGGTYEQPQLLGVAGASHSAAPRASTRRREAYFIDYAEKIRAVARMPLMVTGGFRTRAAMEEALAGACDVIGLARPLVSDPACPGKLLAGAIAELPAQERALNAPPRSYLARLDFMSYVRAYAGVAWYYIQIFRLADGLPPDPRLTRGRALRAFLWDEQKTAWRMRAARRAALSSALTAPPA